MGSIKLLLIIILGLSGPVFGFLFLHFRPPKLPIPTLTKLPTPNLADLVAPLCNLPEPQLRTVSRDLADRFSLVDYKPLDQPTLTSFVNRITNATTSVLTSRTPPSPKDITKFFANVHTAIQNRGLCALCQLAIALLQLDFTLLPMVLQLICDIYIALSTLTLSNFCSGIIELNKPILGYIREHSKILDPQLGCSIILQSNECYFPKPALTWTSAVSTSPKIIPTVNPESSPPLKFLHLSDFHISLNYQEGGVTNCGYPLCCLKGLGNPIRGGIAGKWGDYACDVSPVMYTKALKFISENHKDLAAIYFTGDIVDHSVWNTTMESNKEVIKFAFDSLKNFFPNITVYPILGNHEPQPLNVYAPKEAGITEAGLSQQWLYTEAALNWNKWLPATALDTVEKNGWYSVNFSKKLKIIGINSNLCYCYNWWLMYNTTFLNEHLLWLNDELEASERIGQFVHIIGHNSMGNRECIAPWENSYANITERFSHIIKAQFVGHTHTDEIKIFYDSKKKPINLSFNGASITTYQNYNPNYKIVHVRPDTMEVVDIDTYIFNMTAANLTPDQDPHWFKLYSMKSEYDLPDLSPASYDALCDRMASDKNLTRKYWLNYVRYGDPSLKEGCDDQCLNEVHCKIQKTKSYENVKSYCTL